MWTNWQKLCSRTGPNRTTYCKRDPYFNVTPSEPFCAVDTEIRQFPLPEPERVLASRMRFCARTTRSFQPNDRDVPTGPLRCAEYEAARPFSGIRIEQMVHPWCATWGTGEPGRAICTVAPTPGVDAPLCGDRSIRSLRRSEAFVCTSWVHTVPCKHPIGGREPAKPNNKGIYIYDARPLKFSPVWGTFCADR